MSFDRIYIWLEKIQKIGVLILSIFTVLYAFEVIGFTPFNLNLAPILGEKIFGIFYWCISIFMFYVVSSIVISLFVPESKKRISLGKLESFKEDHDEGTIYLSTNNYLIECFNKQCEFEDRAYVYKEGNKIILQGRLKSEKFAYIDHERLSR